MGVQTPNLEVGYTLRGFLTFRNILMWNVLKHFLLAA